MSKFVYIPIYIALLSGCAGVQSRYHRVQSGENIRQIASKYEVSVSSIEEANPELRKGLKAGKKIYIPFETNPKWNTDPGDVIAESNASGSIRGNQGNASDALGPKFLWPVRGNISSAFGARRGNIHEGIDIAAPRGTKVVASRSGHVIFSGSNISGYGKMVIVRHTDSFATVYAHLSKIHVKKGQFISRGNRLGNVGSTGHATGPHLHFEIRNERIPTDPLQYLPGQYASK